MSVIGVGAVVPKGVLGNSLYLVAKCLERLSRNSLGRITPYSDSGPKEGHGGDALRTGVTAGLRPGSRPVSGSLIRLYSDGVVDRIP